MPLTSCITTHCAAHRAERDALRLELDELRSSYISVSREHSAAVQHAASARMASEREVLALRAALMQSGEAHAARLAQLEQDNAAMVAQSAELAATQAEVLRSCTESESLRHALHSQEQRTSSALARLGALQRECEEASSSLQVGLGRGQAVCTLIGVCGGSWLLPRALIGLGAVHSA